MMQVTVFKDDGPTVNSLDSKEKITALEMVENMRKNSKKRMRRNKSKVGSDVTTVSKNWRQQ